MKRRFLCRVTSFALAAILAAESSMTAAAAQNGVSQGTLAVETEETVVESEGETAFGTNDGTETVSEQTGETEQETTSETVGETEQETSSETEETEQETSSETEEETEQETFSETAEETERETSSETEETEQETTSEAEEGNETAEETTAEDEAETETAGEAENTASSNAKENETKAEETEQSTAGVEKVTLNKTELTLRLNTVGILEAVVEPNGAEKVVWTSSAPEIASVDNGTVRALKGGKAVITATAGEKSAECEVTVTVPVNKIEPEKTSVEIDCCEHSSIGSYKQGHYSGTGR